MKNLAISGTLFAATVSRLAPGNHWTLAVKPVGKVTGSAAIVVRVFLRKMPQTFWKKDVLKTYMLGSSQELNLYNFLKNMEQPATRSSRSTCSPPLCKAVWLRLLTYTMVSKSMGFLKLPWFQLKMDSKKHRSPIFWNKKQPILNQESMKKWGHLHCFNIPGSANISGT